MIINGIQHLGTAVPPRDHGDRAPQQAPPHEPAVTMGDCGLDLRDGSVVRSKTRGTGYWIHLHAAGGRTSSELSRTNRAVHARRARLALTREGAARQLVRLAVVRRHRLHGGGAVCGSLPRYVADLAERLRLRALRHGEAARLCGRTYIDAHDALAATRADTPAHLLQRQSLRQLCAANARRWGAHIRTARAAAALLNHVEAINA